MRARAETARPSVSASGDRKIPSIGIGSGAFWRRACQTPSTPPAGLVSGSQGPPEIRGHVGLRAHAQPESRHRALVSIGVLEPYRRQGVAGELLDAAIRWATSQEALTWLDSEIFGHNEPALRLHRKLGFTEMARVTDMYRIEGAPVDDIWLTLRLRNS